MVQVDNVPVLMSQWSVPVGMTVWFWPLPALMRVLMVRVMYMEMLVGDAFVEML